jgi:hypothetical protein
MKIVLKIDYCDNRAALYACKAWHYSKSLPAGKAVYYGVWEDRKFVGAVIFARGASSNLYKQYNLTNNEACELVRVALGKHKYPVSKIVSICLRMLRKRSPKIKLIISFADPAQGHIGAIYQAGGWLYLGTTEKSKQYKDCTGKLWHSRMIRRSGKVKSFGKYIPALKPEQCEIIECPPKYKYAMPLEVNIREELEKISKPYPKRVSSLKVKRDSFQNREGGAIPTETLHLKE